MHHKDADLFIICCATDKRNSLESIKAFVGEIRNIEHGKPMVLVQTKIDLEDKASRDQIKLEEL